MTLSTNLAKEAYLLLALDYPMPEIEAALRDSEPNASIYPAIEEARDALAAAREARQHER